MEPVDIHRESLLDARVPSAASPKVARVLLVTKYSVSKEELTEEVQEMAADNGYTGAFLFFDGSTYSKVVLITLEADALGLQQFMTGPIATGMLTDARVVSFSDDLSQRAWSVFTVVSRTANMFCPSACIRPQILSRALLTSLFAGFAHCRCDFHRVDGRSGSQKRHWWSNDQYCAVGQAAAGFGGH